MNPFLFGTSEKALFGIHHASRGHRGGGGGVVICPPIGQEYMRTHRALRQLAVQLARAGRDTLRFDYFATGDSAGDAVEADLDQWVRDVGLAIDEIKDAAAVSRVALVGVRLGALLAVLAAAGRGDVDGLTLWDPVVHGRAYVGELLALSRATYPGRPRSRGSAPVDGETVGAGGWPLTPHLRAQLETVDLTTVREITAKRLLLVASEERPEYASLRTHWQTVHPSFVYRHIPAAGDWDEVERFGAALLPQAIILGITDWLTKEV